MPISAQQWRVSVGLFNCSRMRWLLKGGGAKMTAAPSSSRSNTHAVKRGILPLLYLLLLTSAMPPRLLLNQSGDVELNPGPVETDGKPHPMSSWNVAALISLRERLKLNALMNTGLSDKLEKVAGGFMSQREAQMVRGLPTSSDQVDRVIETLRGKKDDDFEIFCQMLRNSNQGVWADELERLSKQFKQGGGAHALLNIRSKPTLAELDEFIIRSITDGWEQVLLHLGVLSSVIHSVKGVIPGQSEEACRRVLNKWLKAKPGTGSALRTWRSVLEALEKGGYRQLTDKLKREHFGLISSWNNDALLFLREKLKLNVSKNTDLLHKLDKATGGFLNEYVATMVRELPSNIAQVGRVIETLCEKGDKDFQKFCRILRDSKEVIWADEIERVAEQLKRVEESGGGGEREQVETFSNCLQEFYINMKVVEDEWLPADQALPFVNLALARFHLMAQRAQEMFVEAVREGADNVYTYQTGKVECEAIPGLVKEHKLVIISGAPGVGKSTLARKICQDICQTPGCHGYTLAILVELRDLLHFKNDFQLVDILQLFRGMMTQGTLLEKLSVALYKNLGRGVLFILDGFDELPPHLRQSSFLVNLLSHNRDSLLRHCDVILTSRSIVTSEIYHQMQKARTQVSLVNIEVLGFTQDQIKNYAKQYFTDQGRPDMLDTLVRKIGAFPQIRGLCSIPVVLSIICQVFLFREDLPPTLTQIYNDYLCVKVLKYSEDLPELNSIMDLPKDHDIYKLGEIAYKCIQKQKVVFDSSDLQGLGERFSDRKRGCGVLTARPIRCDPKSKKSAIESFFFIHLTVQEFLAAVYVSLLTADRQCEVWARYLGEPHMAQVWRFYCGLTKLQHFDRLQNKLDLYHTDFQMQCLYETQDISLVCRLMPRIVGEEVTVMPETAYDSTAYGYCLSVLPSLKRLTIEKGASSAEIHRLLEPVYANGTLHTLQLPLGSDWRKVEVALDRFLSLERNASTDDSQKDGVFKGHFGKVYLKRPLLSTIVKLLCLQHVAEVECVGIQRCEAVDHEVLMEMERSLSENKTMNKMTLNGGSVTLPKQFCHHLLLGIKQNISLSEVYLKLNPQSWYCPDDVPAGDQESIQHLTLWGVPVDVFKKGLSFFSKVKELECPYIHPPQEGGVREAELKLDEMEQTLAEMHRLEKLLLGMGFSVSESLMVRFNMSVLKGLSKQHNISEFVLYNWGTRKHLLKRMLSRLPPNEKDMFTTGRYTNERGYTHPCIRFSSSRSDRLSANVGDGDNVNTDVPPTASSDDGNSSPLSPSIHTAVSGVSQHYSDHGNTHPSSDNNSLLSPSRPPGRQGELTTPTCGTHLPSRIPIRRGPLQINNSLVSSRNQPRQPKHILNSSRHRTLPPSCIPLSTRYVTNQTKLTQPLPLPTRGPNTHTHSHSNRAGPT